MPLSMALRSCQGHNNAFIGPQRLGELQRMSILLPSLPNRITLPLIGCNHRFREMGS